MIEELDGLNQGLERQVADRTATLRARERELEAQNMRFDAAMNNMATALLMFDSSALLVIHNRRYLEMYGFPDGAVTIGCSLLDLIALQVGNGTLVGDPEQLAENVLAAAARRKTTSWLNELPDGRTISVRVNPMDDGGWVTTHEDISGRRDAERRIAHMARHDALTDLPNRVLLHERLSDAVAQIRPGERVAVLYVDIDGFKGVNDVLGHTVGDELLTAVAGRLLKCADERTFVARVGGDEFALILTGVTHGDRRSPNSQPAFAKRYGRPTSCKDKRSLSKPALAFRSDPMMPTCQAI